MKKFVLQWHIIHKCNLRCKHCYQEDYNKELSEKELIKIFNDFKEFITIKKYKGHINFTGGEPILSKHLYTLLNLCEQNNITFGILTNGTLLTKEIVEKLSNYKNLSFIQVSIDGNKKIHDDIRGIGNFDKTLKSLKLLRKYKIQTMVSFTCNKNNYKTLKEVIRIMRRNKVDRFWCDRLIPFGSNTEEILTTSEYMEVVKLITKESKRKIPFNKTIIHTNRSLQWCFGSNEYYKCSAGISLLTVLADATLLPCRRLPLELGNLKSDSMINLYNKSKIIKDLLKEEIPKECNNCLKKNKCRGGAKCLTYALNNTYKKKDVNCPINN